MPETSSSNDEEGAGERRYVALAMSGGGSRAIAFHLGCLRALHDRDILRQVRIMSTVSGGSVIGALYAYGDHSSFDDFDRKVVGLLKKGLHRSIVVNAFFGSETPKIIATLLINGGVSMVTSVLRKMLGVVRWTTGLQLQCATSLLARLDEALPFWGSLTTAFARALSRAIFGDQQMRDVRIPDTEVMINACDLRTGTAFRFGSHVSGGWRYGKVVDGGSIPVANAVAASAAFPLLLPPLVERYAFLKQGTKREETVVLTDGGVYDNLGVSVLEPGRDAAVSINRYAPTHIICLNAGPGQFPLGSKTLWWPGRVVKSLETVYRKASDGAYGRLHSLAEAGEVAKFMMVYLGQDDEKLPIRPPDLIPRSHVRDYPTDFAPMSDRNIELLTKRGEQLARLLINHYLSDL